MKKYYRAITWLQVILQASIPLLSTVTPAAKANLHVKEELVMRKKVYTLAKGESISTIAQRESLTADQLWLLNRYLFPSRESFDKAGAGEVIYLPYSAQDAQRARSEQTSGQEEQRRYASAASQAGSLLAAKQPADALKQTLSSSAVSGAEQWLNRFGTAKLSVQPGPNLQFSGDMLHPLLETDDHLTFTQFGMRRQDKRTIANLGFGQRFAFDKWLLGYNAFYDAQISGNSHQRLGVGGELWSDNLKLAANGYYRLSDWKASRLLTDYNERLANGYDLRAESWLPALPQVGGKLTWEHYFGNEVALFNRDQRQKNPTALTVGLNYTPFPLLNIGLEHSRGRQDVNETRMKFDINYRFNTPLRQHFDTEAVRQQRTLAGKRRDLVDRNNNLVFDYQQQTLITLQLPAEIKGAEGEKQPINFNVTSKYGLDRIEWDESALVARGGKIIALTGNRYQLQLPAFQPDASNSITVSAVARDKRGNLSHRSSMTVRVEGQDYQNLKTQLEITPQRLPADGQSEAIIQWRINNLYDRPVRGLAKQLKLILRAVSRSGQLPGSLTEMEEREPGVYQAVFTSLTRPGKLMLTTRLEGSNYQFASGTIELIAATNSATLQEVTPDKKVAIANGRDKVTYTAVVKDMQGNPVPDLPVSWTADSESVTLSADRSVTDAQGNAQVQVSAQRAQEVIISAVVNNQKKAAEAVSFRPDITSGKIISLTLDKTSAVANGIDQVMVEATVEDAQGNPLPNASVNWSTDKADALRLLSSTITDEAGKSRVSVSSTSAGKGRVTAQIAQSTLSTEEITFKPDAARIKITNVKPDKALAKADGQELITFSATVLDVNNNPVPDQYVHWTADSPLVAFRERKAFTKTDAQGVATVSLSSKKALDVVITASAGDAQLAAKKVRFSAQGNAAQITRIDISKKTVAANGQDSARYTVSVRDAWHNRLSHVKVAFRVTDNPGATITPAEAETDAQGQVTAVLTGTRIGEATVEVTPVGGDAQLAEPVVFYADGVSGKIEALRQSAESFVAGTEGVTYTVKVSDKNGNPLADTALAWTLIEGDKTQVTFSDTSVTNSQGEAQTTLLGTKAGRYTLRVILNGKVTRDAKPVTINPAAADTDRSTFSTDKSLIASDGKEQALLTLDLRDRYDNVIDNETVTIKQAAALAGFNVTAVQNGGRGIYTASATATTKGQQRLWAEVRGKRVGKAVSIEVGSMAPPLQFANAQQRVVWTKHFTQAQLVQNVPDGLHVTWSSSNPEVATVADDGSIRLLAAGTTIITASTAATAQYNPASAFYQLDVERADPGLLAGNGEPVTAAWADGEIYSVAATYTNQDAVNLLQPVYSSRNEQVVRVDSQGRLHAVKPGTTTITVSTPETAQFKAATASVTYVLNKASLAISFKTSLKKTTDEETFTLQQPLKEIPQDAHVRWESSDKTVVDLSEAGVVQGRISKGRTRLTLSVAANEYYNASSGYYDVQIYSKPVISLGEISYISKGSSAVSGWWTPVFTDDNMSISWSADTSSEYSKPESVTVYLKEPDGQELAKEVIPSPAGSSSTRLAPETTFWGRTVMVEIVAKGYGNLTTIVQSPQRITVRNLPPNQIWNSLIVRSHIETRVGSRPDDACQESHFGSRHNNYAVATGDRISFGGKRLLSPMSIKGLAKHRKKLEAWETEPFSAPVMTVYTDSRIAFGEALIYDVCWRDNTGGYFPGVRVNYAGAAYDYFTSNDHGWGGNGDGMYINYEDSIR